MKPPRQPLFVPPRAYRQRRLADAARLLPWLGVWLMVLPILWAPAGPEQGRSTAWDGIYLFGVWAGLIVAAGLLSARLAGAGAAEGAVGRPGEEGHPGEEGRPPAAPARPEV